MAGWFSTKKCTFSFMFEYLSKSEEWKQLCVMCRDVCGSKRHNIVDRTHVARDQVSDTVSGIYTCDTVR